MNNEINNFIPNYTEIKAHNNINSQDVFNTLNNEINNIKSKIEQLNIELNSEKNKNQKLNDENKKLKEELDKYNNEKKHLNNKVTNLQTNLNNLNIEIEKLTKEKNDLNEIKNYLNNQILTLKTKLIYNPKVNKKPNLGLINPEKIISIQFKSMDENIDLCKSCKKSEIFAHLEEKLYELYPEYKGTNNIFICNGVNVNRFMSLEENGIKESDKIYLNI